MELTNTISARRADPDASPGALRFALATAASLLFPFAPHTAADAFDRLTGRRVWEEPWPAADPALLERHTFELVCQVNGKVRDRVEAPTGAARDELERLALEAPNVRTHVEGREVVKVVVVPGRLVNVVVRWVRPACGSSRACVAARRARGRRPAGPQQLAQRLARVGALREREVRRQRGGSRSAMTTAAAPPVTPTGRR